MNCEEIFIADLIQEANISLLMALGEEEPEEKDEKWLLDVSGVESAMLSRSRHRGNLRMTIW